MKKSMDEALDEILFNKKTKQSKKRITKVEEKQNDVKDLIEQDENNEDEDITDNEENADDASTDDAKDATAKESRKAAKKRKSKGEKVMEVSLSISGVDQGTIELGSEEYATITDMSALMDLFDIDAGNITDPKKTVKSFVLSIQEFASQTNENTLSIMMQSNKDDTFSINVLVNEIGQTFNDIARAVSYFNTQYQITILDVINKETRE